MPDSAAPAPTLHSIGRSSGTATPLTALSAAGVHCDDLLLLEEDGFSEFVQSDCDIVEMSMQAISSALARRPISPAAVDAIIVNTESLWECDTAANRHQQIPDHKRLHDAFLRSLAELGLVHAHVHGNWLAGCGNFVSSLELGRALMDSGGCNTVLIVGTDRTGPGMSRLLPNGSAVYSDLAAACILDRAAESGYRLQTVIRHTDLSLVAVRDGGNLVAEAESLRKAFRQLGRKIEAVGAPPLREHAVVVADNFHSMLLMFLCEALDVRFEQLVLPTKAAAGHAYSVDGLLSLDALASTSAIRPGDHVAVLNMGMCSFGAAFLECC